MKTTTNNTTPTTFTITTTNNNNGTDPHYLQTPFSRPSETAKLDHPSKNTTTTTITNNTRKLTNSFFPKNSITFPFSTTISATAPLSNSPT